LLIAGIRTKIYEIVDMFVRLDLPTDIKDAAGRGILEVVNEIGDQRIKDRLILAYENRRGISAESRVSDQSSVLQRSSSPAAGEDTVSFTPSMPIV